MQGYQVNRKGGWDCHGLPVELAVEKELGFSGKADIEAFGIAEFNARCRESVQRYVDLWEQMTDRMGCWIDMREPYRTMDPAYVESVWWALKQIHDRGLLVEDYRVAPYCPRCGTGLSDHELAQGYETVTDPRLRPVPADLRPVRRRGPRLLVWTTTPWTLVSNAAGRRAPRRRPTSPPPTATRRSWWPSRWSSSALGEGWTVEDRFTGADMVGWTYQRPFELVEWPARTDADGPTPHFVVTEDYVTAEDGTGLVHQSPAFGEDDFAVLPAQRRARWSTRSTPQGHFEDDLDLVGGQFFRHANADLVADLERRAACCSGTCPTSTATRTAGAATPRCSTTPSRPGTSAPPRSRTTCSRENEKTNWFPETIKHGRYGDWLNNNIDWALSRSRYWGTPLPIWRCARGPPDLRRLAGRARPS